jgi:hypothetical protein
LKAKIKGPLPSLKGLQTDNITVIGQYHNLTTAFASCFHTTESHQEILDRITKLRIENDPYAKFGGPLKSYTESFVRLLNNLIRIHNSLPGNDTKKEVKIYWNERVEKILFPYLFKVENIDVKEIIFELISGEQGDSPFQASTTQMNFRKQLQFVCIGLKERMTTKKSKIAELFENVCGKGSISGFDHIMAIRMHKHPPKTGNSLVDSAHLETMRSKILRNLQELETKKTIIPFMKMSFSEREDFIKNLMLPK